MPEFSLSMLKEIIAIVNVSDASDVAIATLENLLKMAVLNMHLNKTDMEKVG